MNFGENYNPTSYLSLEMKIFCTRGSFMFSGFEFENQMKQFYE